MLNEIDAGWCALFLAITRNISPAKALDIVDGRSNGGRALSWEQFLAATRAGEEKAREQLRRRNASQRMREYQRQYRKTHPLTERQRARRREYLRRYRDERKPYRPGMGQSKRAEATTDSSAANSSSVSAPSK